MFLLSTPKVHPHFGRFFYLEGVQMLFPQLHKLTGMVGNNRDNEEADVAATKLNFARLGYYNEPIENGIIDAGLTSAIRRFQKDKNLKNDGWMRPAGETETTLHQEVDRHRKQALNKRDSPVDYNQRLLEYGFEKQGTGKYGAFWSNPLQGITARQLGVDVRDTITKNQYPDLKADDDEADAFRHALWSYKLAKKYDSDYAKMITDSYERSEFNDRKKGSLLMDLHNNAIGRTLAKDERNYTQKDEDVIREAIKRGELRISPYRLNDASDFYRRSMDLQSPSSSYLHRHR
jgi:peptidoglycan hydrolase-like protein with peptidoglycan-binding domain